MGAKRAKSRIFMFLPAMLVAAVVFTMSLLEPHIMKGFRDLPLVCELHSTCGRLVGLRTNEPRVSPRFGQDEDYLEAAVERAIHSRESWGSDKQKHRTPTPLNSFVSPASPPSCDGRRIYLYDLPSSMNDDLVSPDNCSATGIDFFCHSVRNDGLGRRLYRWMDKQPIIGVAPDLRESLDDVAQAWRGRWYLTHSKMLDLLLLRRLQNYTCLERDPAKADALFIPAFVSWQWWSILEHGEQETRGDEPGKALVKYLSRQKPFIERGGKDHILPVGQPIWDLIRMQDHGWGTNLLYLPELANVTVLVTETTPYHNRPNRIVSVPNPTAFHPASQAELDGWLAQVRAQERPYLYSLVGGRRSKDSPQGRLREALFDQCSADPRCLLLDCATKTLVGFAPSEANTGVMRDRMSTCMDPRRVTAVMLSSRFCLEPVGDSKTRRSTFDALAAGCIPVYFSPESFEQQYEWFFPEDRSNLSMLFPIEKVVAGNIKVGDELARVSDMRVDAMREEGLKAVPEFLWWDHTAGGDKDFRDQFDVIIENVLKLAREKKLVGNSAVVVEEEGEGKEGMDGVKSTLGGKQEGEEKKVAGFEAAVQGESVGSEGTQSKTMARVTVTGPENEKESEEPKASKTEVGVEKAATTETGLEEDGVDKAATEVGEEKAQMVVDSKVVQGRAEEGTASNSNGNGVSDNSTHDSSTSTDSSSTDSSNTDSSSTDSSSTDSSSMDSSSKDIISSESSSSSDSSSTDSSSTDSSSSKDSSNTGSTPSHCDGRRIFLYSLPSSMNDDLVKNCEETKISNFCRDVQHNGLGRRLSPWLESDGKHSVTAETPPSSDLAEAWRHRWHMTHMYMQDVLLLHRLKQYPCLESNASEADVLYVPAHLGWLWWSVVMHGQADTDSDKPGEALAAWLAEQRPFQERGGRDHFLITGRPVWDLVRHGDVKWGTNLLYIPALANITMITSETSMHLEAKQKVVSISQPTGFHPASHAELEGWLAHVRAHPRPYLYSLVAGRRSNSKTEGKLREVLFDACDEDPRCIALDCKEKAEVEFASEDASEGVSAANGPLRQNVSVCMDPRRVTAVMLQSRFCLQPLGDSATRRSTFNSLTAGCIPVYFSRASFEDQYEWFFPQDRTDLSVRFPLKGVEKGRIHVGDELAKVSQNRWEEMREAALEAVPGFLWHDDGAGREKDFEDAFDVIVDGMLSLSSKRSKKV